MRRPIGTEIVPIVYETVYAPDLRSLYRVGNVPGKKWDDKKQTHAHTQLFTVRYSYLHCMLVSFPLLLSRLHSPYL